MTTEWAVVATAEQFTLDARNAGELTFTVANPGDVADTVVFDVLPGEGTQRTWFTVPEPQRSVPGHDSVSFLVRLIVPSGTPARRYDVTGLAYSADTAPEESSRTSGRVTYDVRASEKPPNRWPWIIAAVVLVLLVGGVTTFLLTRPKAPAPPKPVDIVIEAETLVPKAIVTSPTNDGSLVLVDNKNTSMHYSGGAQLAFDAVAIDDSMLVTIDVPREGDYMFSEIRTRAPVCGNTVWQIDGHAIGQQFFGFSTKFEVTGWQPVGTVHLVQGTHEFTLTVVGKLQSAPNYFAGVDALRLTQQSKA